MGKNRDVRMFFEGDFAHCGQCEHLIAINGREIFGSARKYIDTADSTIFNLEVPICGETDEAAKVGPVIRAVPETLRALDDAGVDAVCLANNHILDYGAADLSQTLAALYACGIGHVGAGLDSSSAEGPLRLEIRGRRNSVLAFAEREFNLSDDGQVGAAILDPIRMMPLIMRERAQADAINVCVHGGNGYFSYSRLGLWRLCLFLIDIGAGAVIGHYPHISGPY